MHTVWWDSRLIISVVQPNDIIRICAILMALSRNCSIETNKQLMLYRIHIHTRSSDIRIAYYTRIISSLLKDTAFSAGKQFVVSLQPQSVTAAFNCSWPRILHIYTEYAQRFIAIAVIRDCCTLSRVVWDYSSNSLVVVMTHQRLNTGVYSNNVQWKPIADKYRKGTMKSTLHSTQVAFIALAL